MNADLRRRMDNMLKLCKVEANQDEYDCPICEDRGYIFKQDENDYTVAVPCECLEKKQSIEKLKKSGLSDVFKTKTFKTFIATEKYQIEAKKKAIEYCNNFERNNASIILSGQPGAGKTHLGIAIMLKLLENNTGCVYREYTSMLIDLKQSCMDQTNYIKELEKYINPRVLFLDDFLKGRPNDVDLKYIYKVINTRYLKEMPIIISTEKSINEIINWDEAVGSRLIEMSQGNVIEFKNNINNNYRLRGVI